MADSIVTESCGVGMRPGGGIRSTREEPGPHAYIIPSLLFPEHPKAELVSNGASKALLLPPLALPLMLLVKS